MSNLRMTVALCTLILVALPGCPRWWWAHAGDWRDKDGGSDEDGGGELTCETDADCDDGDGWTLDECSAEGLCEDRKVSYESDMQPLFAAKCSGCHVDSGDGTCFGRVCFVSSYDALELPSTWCDEGVSVAECAYELVLDGSMPRGRDCSGDPELDAGNDACLTDKELRTFEAWLQAGYPETTP